MSFTLNNPKEISERLGLQEKGPVQAFATSRCAYYMDEFVPLKSGNLKNNKWVFEDYIVYHSIYAHYVFQGDVMGPNVPIKNSAGSIVGWFSPIAPKSYTGAKMVYHPEGTQRGSYWHEKMKSAYMDTIVKEVQDYMKLRSAK